MPFYRCIPAVSAALIWLACPGAAQSQELPGGMPVPGHQRLPDVEPYHPSPLGKNAHNFMLRALTDSAGAAPLVRLDAYQGRVVVLNFWASWCGPCRREMPMLSHLADDYADQDVTVMEVAVNDRWADALATWKQRTTGPHVVPAFAQGNRVADTYGVWGIPTTLVLDREGIVREHIIGESTAGRIRNAIDKWLAKAGPKPPPARAPTAAATPPG